MPDVLSDLAHVFHALSDPTRLQLLVALGLAEEACVQGLVRFIGRSQPAVSQHLGVLRKAGLVEVRRDGKHHLYRATVPLHLKEYIDEIMRSWGTPTYSEFLLRVRDTRADLGQSTALFKSPSRTPNRKPL